MSTETFYGYRGFRWMWINLGLLVGFVVAYIYDRPVGGRNGGTALGYGLGIFAALSILYLMWYGIRKRSYHAKHTNLKGCLSGHVWLGVALAVVVPLHCAFQFGCNVHTLAYVLMLIVVISGIWGAFHYAELSPRIASHRGAGTVSKLIEQVHIISRDIDNLAREKSDQFMQLFHVVDFSFKPGIFRALFGPHPKPIDAKRSAELIAKLTDSEQAEGLKLISLVNKKRDLARQVLTEAAIVARLKLWLLVHLPLSFALLVALSLHIFSVLYYGSRP